MDVTEIDDCLQFRTGPTGENRLLFIILSIAVAATGLVSGAWAILLIPSGVALFALAIYASENYYLFDPKEGALKHHCHGMKTSKTQVYRFDQIESIYVKRDDVKPSLRSPGGVAYTLAVRIDPLTTFPLVCKQADSEELNRIKRRIDTMLKQSQSPRSDLEKAESDEHKHNESIELRTKQLDP